MKKRRVRILMAKGWYKVACFVSFSLLSLVCNHASAQKAGDIITGVVSENCYNDRDSLASLLGVKKSKLKAVRYLKDAKAIYMWGSDGANGVIEIVTKKQYRKYRKEGKLEEDWQLLK